MDTQIMGERTWSALSLLLANSHDAQKHMGKEFGRYSNMSYLKEWCTIRLCGPRRSGHTHCINRMVEKLDDEILVITALQEMKKNVVAKHVCSADQINSLTMDAELLNVSAVIVDCTSLVGKRQIEDIMYVASTILSAKRGENETFFLIFME